jgi:hypothetical protein
MLDLEHHAVVYVVEHSPHLGFDGTPGNMGGALELRREAGMLGSLGVPARRAAPSS